MSFKDKVVLVTGGSSGIGAATAILFAKEGADVAIVGRNETKLQNVAEQCASVGNAPLVIRADVSNDDDAKRIINETIHKYGKLDILVNNAGILRYVPISAENMQFYYNELMNTNLWSAVHLTHLAVPHLTKTKGNIVNISSVAGQCQVSGAVLYGVTKAALDHFTRGVAKELAPSGIRVNAISPGPVTTDIVKNLTTPLPTEFNMSIPLNRMSAADEIGELVLFLGSDKAVGITGSIFVSDNGMLVQ